MSQPTRAYDYERQTWLERHGERCDGAWLWSVAKCAHPESMRPECCYAGAHVGEIVVQHSRIHYPDNNEVRPYYASIDFESVTG